MASILAFALCYFAFALLALSQSAHMKVVDPNAPAPDRPTQKRKRLGAALLLGIALSLLLETQGGAFGSLLWMTLLSAGALSLSFTLSWRPGWLRFIARLVASTRR
ncbi:DUF3325 domain-containing protein [Stutzerimonas sp. VN223-3]|uniref:DUF3325 domain-containing protein n=1 Tax=Stutzerimonas sp. VN223-3 TaxID=3384601 RepID=UPI0038B5B5CD